MILTTLFKAIVSLSGLFLLIPMRASFFWFLFQPALILGFLFGTGDVGVSGAKEDREGVAGGGGQFGVGAEEVIELVGGRGAIWLGGWFGGVVKGDVEPFGEG